MAWPGSEPTKVTMANLNTSIEWTDVTWSPVTGCTKVSPGCAHCYAEDLAKRFWKGRPFEDVRFHTERLGQPYRWRKPRRVFVNSMSDLFHEDLTFKNIEDVFGVMARTPRHTYQILTKRPDDMRRFILSKSEKDFRWAAAWWRPGALTWPLQNVWLGVSVENQTTAAKRIPILIDTPAAVRFLSVEPLLDRVDLTAYLKGHGDFQRSPIDWVIVGGESGQSARPCNIGWVKRLVLQCEYCAVACFVKQLGAKPVGAGDTNDTWLAVESDDGTRPIVLQDSKGGNWSEWPDSFRVRQFPKGKAHA